LTVGGDGVGLFADGLLELVETELAGFGRSLGKQCGRKKSKQSNA
jgi:hypothetical protein